MRTLRGPAIAIGFALLTGCATYPILPLPAPPRADSSVVAIRVALRLPPHLGKRTWPAEQVYFIRLGNIATFVGEPIGSTYASHGYVYLLDAAPGRYAAVAATARPGLWRGTLFGASGLEPQTTLYFPPDLIQKTVVTVGPSGTEFMGEWVVTASGPASDADDTQRHYLRLAAPGYGHVSKQSWWGGEHQLGSEHESDRSHDAWLRFLEFSEGQLRDTGWSFSGGSGPP